MRIGSSRGPRPRAPRNEFAEVDVWLRFVNGDADTDDHHLPLDDSEWARAEGYRFERDRVRFVNRRAFLRSVLATYLGIEPAAVRICSAEGGRPELEGCLDLAFNTSHSEGLAAVAVSYAGPVGVDIEHLRHVEGALDLAQELFRPCELDALRSAPTAQQSAVFLAFWTRKESYVKAVGRGLSIPLDTFDVTSEVDGVLRPRGPSDLLPYGAVDFVYREHVGAVTLAGGYVRPRVWLTEIA